MPKNVDPEHDPLIRDTLSEAATFDPATEGKQLTQRELGRIKKKKALLAKIQEQGKGKETEGRPTTLATGSGTHDEVDAEVEAGREIKRTRSEGASVAGVGESLAAVAEGRDADVEMHAS